MTSVRKFTDKRMLFSAIIIFLLGIEGGEVVKIMTRSTVGCENNPIKPFISLAERKGTKY